MTGAPRRRPRSRAALAAAGAVVCLLAAGLGLSGCPGNDERPSGYYERPRLDAGRLAPRGAEGRAGSPAAGPDTRAPGPDGGAEGGDTAGPGATAAPPVDLTRMPLPDFAALYRGVRPSVVSVYTTRRPLPPRLPVGPSRFADAIGSGVVLTPGGEILTNHHVVENATGVWVRLSDGRTFRAQTAGTDPPTDLALLKVDGVGGALQAATLGDSDAVQVGDWVLAVGNPFGLEQSVTRGIVSAKGRREVAPELGGYVDWLQTDAAINPGSSGGPLFDLGGRVVGINAALSAEGQRLSFAIPVNLARDVVQRLRTTGQVTRGWLGVVAAPSEPGGDPGVRVADVVPGSPAARAGLQAGDVVVALDGEPLDAPFDLRWRVAMAGVGARVKLTVRRDGEERLVSVKLATLAPQPPAEPPR